MRKRRRARRRLLAAMGVGSVEELRRIGAPPTLRSLWHGLGWMRLLVEALLTDPELPGQVTARVRRPWRWMGGWMLCLVARPVVRLLVRWGADPRRSAAIDGADVSW